MSTKSAETLASGKVVVPSDLSPADAEATRVAVLEALGAAKAAATPLEIGLDADRAGPCAIQVMVATKRSADAASVSLTIPDQTRHVLTEMGIDMKGAS